MEQPSHSQESAPLIQPPLWSDLLGLILQHLPDISTHLTLRLVCSSLARDICSESHLLCFHLRTIDQLDHLKQSLFVGSNRIHNVKVMDKSHRPYDIVRSLPLNVTKLDCSGCEQLTSGCFDTLVTLSFLRCRCCTGLTDGCFDTLMNLTRLCCDGCTQLTYDYLDKLVEHVPQVSHTLEFF